MSITKKGYFLIVRSEDTAPRQSPSKAPLFVRMDLCEADARAEIRQLKHAEKVIRRERDRIERKVMQLVRKCENWDERQQKINELVTREGRRLAGENWRLTPFNIFMPYIRCSYLTYQRERRQSYH